MMHNESVSGRYASQSAISGNSRRNRFLSSSLRNVPRTALVVNPSSRNGFTGKNWDSLLVKIRKSLKGDVEVALSQRPGDATILTRVFLKRGFRSIVAIGGDGTINEVANGFFEQPRRSHKAAGNRARVMNARPVLKPINPEAVLGIIPTGTRNVLAKSLGIPEGIVASCRSFASGRPRWIDTIVATVTTQDHLSVKTRVFLNAAEIGLGGEIIERSRKVRKVTKSRLISTITGILATVPSYQSNSCEIIYDKTRRELVNLTMAIIANGKYVGGGFMPAPDARMSDGKLDVVIVKDSGSLRMLDELVPMKDGNYTNGSNIRHDQSKGVYLESKEREITVAADGETIGILPAQFTVLPRSLRLKF